MANLKTTFPRNGNPKISNFYNFGANYVGDAMFVDSVNGSSDGPGFSPESAFATVAQAIAAITANGGYGHWIIYLLPWHAETVGAAGLAWNKAGLTIVGLGEGNYRPTFTWHTTDAVVTISGANTTVRNIRTKVDLDEVVSMFLVTGAGVTLDTVDFVDGGSTQALQWLLTTNAADQLTIKNCYHVQTTAAGTAQKWIQLVGTNDTQILDNKILMTAFASTSSHVISGSTAVVNCLIARNYLQFLGATVTIVVNCVTGSTGAMIGNHAFSGTSVSTAAAFTGDGMFFSQNFWLDDAAASAILAPAGGSD